jgi:peptide/nickel transport system ATP-binding protein
MSAEGSERADGGGEGAAPVLSVRGLTVSFATDGGVLRAVDAVSFDVPRGRTVALVGESGSGKSVTAFSIMRLVPSPPGKIEGGQIVLDGEGDLLRLPERRMRDVRGGRVAIVFQEPMTSLNPVYTVGAQIVEAVRLHRPVSRREARKRAEIMLAKVGLPNPPELFESYPHELSGGMRQRVMIAMALACDPALLIADEPTTALDMMTQAQILALLRELRRELGMSLLLIAHDIAVVSELADEIVVLYAGQVVESGPAAEVLASPRHPYTRALMQSVPPADAPPRGKANRMLPTIVGAVPDLRTTPIGCRFSERCTEVFERCRVVDPELVLAGGAAVRCFLHDPEVRRPAAAVEATT